MARPSHSSRGSEPPPRRSARVAQRSSSAAPPGPAPTLLVVPSRPTPTTTEAEPSRPAGTTSDVPSRPSASPSPPAVAPTAPAESLVVAPTAPTANVSASSPTAMDGPLVSAPTALGTIPTPTPTASSPASAVSVVPAPTAPGTSPATTASPTALAGNNLVEPSRPTSPFPAAGPSRPARLFLDAVYLVPAVRSRPASVEVEEPRAKRLGLGEEGARASSAAPTGAMAGAPSSVLAAQQLLRLSACELGNARVVVPSPSPVVAAEASAPSPPPPSLPPASPREPWVRETSPEERARFRAQLFQEATPEAEARWHEELVRPSPPPPSADEVVDRTMRRSTPVFVPGVERVTPPPLVGPPPAPPPPPGEPRPPTFGEIAAWSERMSPPVILIRIAAGYFPDWWVVEAGSTVERRLQALCLLRLTEGCETWPSWSCERCHQLGVPCFPSAFASPFGERMRRPTKCAHCHLSAHPRCHRTIRTLPGTRYVGDAQPWLLEAGERAVHRAHLLGDDAIGLGRVRTRDRTRSIDEDHRWLDAMSQILDIRPSQVLHQVLWTLAEYISRRRGLASERQPHESTTEPGGPPEPVNRSVSPASVAPSPFYSPPSPVDYFSS